MKYLLSIQWMRRALCAVLDVIIILACSVFAALVRFDFGVSETHMTRTLFAMLWGAPVHIVIFWVMELYVVLWRYAGGLAFLKLGFASGIAGLANIAINEIFNLRLSNSILLLTSIFAFGCIALTRFTWHYITKWRKQIASPAAPSRRALIVGGGMAAAWVIGQYIERQHGVKPVAVVDDDTGKQGLKIHGIPVAGRIEDVPTVVESFDVEEIIIAIPSLKNKRFVDIATLCASTKLPVRTVSEPTSVGSDGKLRMPTMRKLNTTDFLSRSEVALDMDGISGYLRGKVILVTGGGGSIGSEICRQILRFSPKRLIIFDIYENGAYDLKSELTQLYGADLPLEICIGSVKDRARLDGVLGRYRPSVVFHAAAHKHVPLMETAPLEAIKNNIFGTRNVLEAADRNGVERFVILSTDKAVNPTNVMGATKRVAEMLIQSYRPENGMKCMAVRFGNVLGSHGSVIPLFARQIENGGPVTLTHPDMQRYFMTIPEAAQLVLQAGSLAQAGAIYVLDMGKPMRIYDLAEQLIRFYGYEPNADIKIEITGLRPGEKLYEELMMDEEAAQIKKTSHDLIFVAPPIPMDAQAFRADLTVLERIGEQDAERAVQMLERIVATFKRSRSIA